jgi:hypothetical protein
MPVDRGAGGGPWVHGGPRPRWAGARGGGAMAATLRLALTALRGTGGHVEGMGGMRTPGRARCARQRGSGVAVEAGARGGAAQRRRRNYGEGAHATERERANGRSTDGFLTSTRSSGGGPRCRRRCGSGDRRRRGVRDGGGYGGSRLVTPGFKEQNQASYMCAQKVHTYNNRSNSIRNNVI